MESRPHKRRKTSMSTLSHSLVGTPPANEDLSALQAKVIPSDERNAFLLSLPAIPLSTNATDLSRHVYGRLTVLRPVDRNKHKSVMWLCRCACGTYKIVKGSNLAQGCTRSCGCLHRDAATRRCKQFNVPLPLAGKTFGRLTALEYLYTNARHNRVWRCLCECGNYTDVTATDLKAGETKSCGCLKLETSERTLAKLNASDRMKGPNHPNWAPELTAEERKYRRPSIQSVNKEAFKRDCYTCISCGQPDHAQLVGHHLELWHKAPARRYDLGNIITLCRSCHLKFHRSGPRKHANTATFLQWLSKREGAT
jgi:hypothetical protein